MEQQQYSFIRDLNESKMFKTTIENDFSLIVQLDEEGKPFLFEDI